MYNQKAEHFGSGYKKIGDLMLAAASRKRQSLAQVGEDMKQKEKEYEETIPPYLDFIVRLDGKNFSKFTKCLDKPFDIYFIEAMVHTMEDLVDKFNATTGYCHSDEITLIFKKVCNKSEFQAKTNKTVHIYNGRTIKLLTLLSGYCSARFNYHMIGMGYIAANKGKYNEKTLKKLDLMEQCFDARILVLTPSEIVDHMAWRSTYDSPRNCISTYARSFFSQKQLMNKNTKDMLEMMKEKGFNWKIDCPLFLKYGVYAKKELYDKEVEVNEKTIECKRCRVVVKCFRIERKKEYEKVLLDKYWPEDFTEAQELVFEI